MAAWWAEAEAAPGGIEETALYAALNGPAAPAADAAPPAGGARGGRRQRLRRRPSPPPPPRPRATPPAAAPGRWPWSMPRNTPPPPRPSCAAASSPSWSPRATRTSPTWLYTSDLAALSDRVVVLTKGALEVHSAEAIAELGRRNIAVIGSWDDMLPEADKVAATDGSMTLSHRQTVDFARAFPDRPAFHVTHHVNRQIRPSTPPMDRPRTGYFGFLRNTHCPASLVGMIDLVGIDTAKVEMSWLDALPAYNCHWIVRRRAKAHDGWKPFLKGFVAARCNAVVITGRDDDDALQYLGDDYPFYVAGHRRGDPRDGHDAHRRGLRRPGLGAGAGDHGAGGARAPPTRWWWPSSARWSARSPADRRGRRRRICADPPVRRDRPSRLRQREEQSV